jgi:putative NADPH-quinone reductase
MYFSAGLLLTLWVPSWYAMRTLVIHAHPDPTSFSRSLLNNVVKGLQQQDADVRVRSLYRYEDNAHECYNRRTFNPITTQRDLHLYNKLNKMPDVTLALNTLKASIETRLQVQLNENPTDLDWKYPETHAFDDDIIDAVDDLRWCTSIVFVYPTWWYGMPAILKGYFDRVMIPGVAFHYNRNRQYRVIPGLPHIKKIGIVTTYGAPDLIVKIHGDHGRRLVTHGLAPHCALGCRVVHKGLYSIDRSTETQRAAFLENVMNSYRYF